jgi:tRNA-2-methylthio-N6-dimethylallyladenosine synthase
MLGFPGETPEQVENTLRFVEEIRFDAAFMFAYSPREPTQAASLPDQVPPKEKTRRLERLIGLQNAITVEINKGRVGQVVEVLVEGKSHKDPRMWQGLTRGGKTVHFPAGRDLTGCLVPVRAIDGHLWGYRGELL